MARQVEFFSRGIKIAGDLYLPAPSAPDRKGAAIVIGHPSGGVKEQTSALHAQRLAENGFIALAFDAAYQGASEGEPRGLEDPFQRSEDVRSAVTFLSTFEEVDKARIGALGICASGGYVPFAAQTDLRIKAVATVSAVDLGAMTREGLKNTPFELDRATLAQTLEAAGANRIAEAKGEEVQCNPIVPDLPEGPAADEPLNEATEYYRTKRGFHPRSTNRCPVRSADLLANFSAYNFNNLISPRPLLMIAGGEAHTLYFSKEGIERAEEPKELFIVPGRSHMALYDHLDEHMPKLVDFMTNALCN
ncbi:alpha/beta hydrolase [Aspergillus udagawae]|uniref:Dienelactone hydrolase domain-containing protein n=1 Tax=Aspergillus udagawae TaxID=91492 RepID=A0A8E0QZ03_9EURO|nr:uncharacterized protein Aud_009441 [Aspergillus udagawae]GIC92962.1 hypothetical protein Aud_009441 [Aspergillus udagawae]